MTGLATRALAMLAGCPTGATEVLLGSRDRLMAGRRGSCHSVTLATQESDKELQELQEMAFFKALPPCLIGMEACATAHYWRAS
jgi:hypothetical protein